MPIPSEAFSIFVQGGIPTQADIALSNGAYSMEKSVSVTGKLPLEKKVVSTLCPAEAGVPPKLAAFAMVAGVAIERSPV